MKCPKCGTTDPDNFFDEHETCADCEAEEAAIVASIDNMVEAHIESEREARHGS